ncbi:hypothetical protein JCM1841_001899 [Sporobolomyces salmonicolor]
MRDPRLASSGALVASLSSSPRPGSSQSPMMEGPSSLAALNRQPAQPQARPPPISFDRHGPSPPSAAPTTYIPPGGAQTAMEPFLSQTPYQQRQAPPLHWMQPPSQQPPQYQHFAPSSDARPSPPPVHRVYVLTCATCDSFLSDRGMRAVLLLKPHIVLFSTDAAPRNSETYWPDEDAEEEQVERTCDCLTSSLACHGCGRTVGYHIVSPCAKCTASVQKHQRSGNHHRYVFHHSEVSSRERTYYPGERGVINPAVPRTNLPPSSCGVSPVSTRAAAGHLALLDSEKDLLEIRLRNPRAGFPSRQDRRSPPPAALTHSTMIKEGDVLYWHHLVAGGERSKPVDPRTRAPTFKERIGR